MQAKHTILLLISVAALTNCVPNSAPYITQEGRPLNIAHRGLASILPENTIQAFQAALYQGADFIQLDVVYTKQKSVLVMHDPYLTRITNIKNVSDFSTRYSTRQYEGKSKTDWWTDQFTLAELKRLTIKQAQAPGRISIFDYIFTFPTLDQVVEMCIQFNTQHKGKRNPDGRLGGILIEAKDSQMYRNLYGLQIGQSILQVLKKYNISTIEQASAKCPIWLHSFDYGTVKYWSSNTKLPRNYLLQKGNSFNITEVAQYATGIGFEDSLIWDYSLNAPTSYLGQARREGLITHIWTFKDDELLFNSKNNIEMYTIAQNILSLDGVITEFCDIYAPIAQLLKKKGNVIKSKNMGNQLRHIDL